MAKKGSSKERSVTHENFIARTYLGKRSPSSGAADHDHGDVRSSPDGTLFECKVEGGPGKVCQGHTKVDCRECMRTPTIVQYMEKIADEAWSEGKEPGLALRYFAPYSPLANRHGYVDLTVRTTNDDGVRSSILSSLPSTNGN